jgi:integrase
MALFFGYPETKSGGSWIVAKILTQRSVDAGRPKAKRYGKPDGLVPGHRLIVHPSGQKTYALFTRFNGELINLKVGSAAVMTLGEARTEARRLLTMIARGEDPRAVKREAQSVTETFEVVTRRFIERHAKIHNRSWRQTERLIEREMLPRWRHRSIDSITRHDVVALLDTITDRGALTMANRTLATARKLFNWCCERGTLAASPCDRVSAPGPEVKRDRVHTDTELALIWRAADSLDYPFGSFIKLAILLGQRREEIAAMRWSELDPTLTLWMLPATRTKTNVQHQVPIAPAVRAFLKSLPRIEGEAGYVFTVTGKTPISGFSKAKANLDIAIAALNDGTPIPPWRLHDFRRTLASGMARLGVALPVIEKVLAHRSGSFSGIVSVYQHYNFREEMQQALQRWASHVLTLARAERELSQPGRRACSER